MWRGCHGAVFEGTPVIQELFGKSLIGTEKKFVVTIIFIVCVIDISMLLTENKYISILFGGNIRKKICSTSGAYIFMQYISKK